MKFNVTIAIAFKHFTKQLGLDGIPEYMTRIDRSPPLLAVFFKFLYVLRNCLRVRI